jgi:hypothetical protein
METKILRLIILLLLINSITYKVVDCQTLPRFVPGEVIVKVNESLDNSIKPLLMNNSIDKYAIDSISRFIQLFKEKSITRASPS